ncbi:phosphoribosyltransferase [Parapedobacter soli]|uniref:phosphoribosyltransferase n=1 Tax=Parapedobacter soli TaxID=416955 RepID=UPI0021C907A7|nr:phosphoribosyltransferase [Parapedobacter soli]
MPVFDLRFINVSRKDISLDKIHEFIKDGSTKRIRFATSHKNSLHRVEGAGPAGWLNVPFKDSILPIMKIAIDSSFMLFERETQYGKSCYRRIDSEKEYTSIEKFIEEYREVVFLRDLLDLSIALSMNFEDNDDYSEIGKLEYEAKYQGSEEAESKLIDICKEHINKLPYYKKVDYICAMPCSNIKQKSLPRRVVDALDGFENISDDIYWQSKTKSLKDAETIEEKLPILEESNLTIDRNLEGKAVFLFDDLYMSGLSMQYVAMKLKEAGAKWVFGLCLVKSRNNTTR